jgi:hypothetical protein
MFVSFYYPIGLDRNASLGNALHERSGLFFLLIWAFYMFTSTFAHLCIAGIDSAENGGYVTGIQQMFCELMQT